MSVFRRSLPLLSTSFVNRCGTIGLSLLPVLLVERQVGEAPATLVVTLVKAAGLAGVLAGGLLADRVGAAQVVVLSFVLQGLGLGLLPLTASLPLIAAAAIAGRVGQALFQSPARLLLVEWVEPRHHQEAIGWLRTAGNAGQIVSYSVGTLLASLGVMPLMLFDAATSLVAAMLGAPLVRPRPAPAPADGPAPRTRTPRAALLVALAISGYCFLYDLFMVGAAALYTARFGAGGLRLFAGAMVVNTALCTVLGVWAARHLREPRSVFPFGMALTAVGAVLTLDPVASPAVIFLGVFALTLGEVVFTSIAPFVLLSLLPAGRGRGARHGGLLVVQDAGRIAGAACAFPFVVHGSQPVLFAALCGAGALALSVVAGRAAARAEPGPAPEPTPAA